MTDAFNPYREWLGIETAGQSLSHFQLLGLPPDEKSPERIQQAAERATVKVRSHRPGQHAADWARILDEIQAAKKCLLDPQARADYERSLAGNGAARSGDQTGGSASGGAGIRKLLGGAPPASRQPDSPAPPRDVAAPRMEMEVTSVQHDMLPPRSSKSEERAPNPAQLVGSPVPAVGNPAPFVTSVAPQVASPAPMNPAPFVSPAMNVAPPMTGGYASEVATPAWNPAPMAPAPAAAPWGAPVGTSAPPTQAWGSPAPPTPAQVYGYAAPADPMAPATYGAPLNYAPPSGAGPMSPSPMMPVAMAMAPAPYAQPNPVDPMAPAGVGTAAYGVPVYGAPVYGGSPYAAAPGPPATAMYAGPSVAPAYAAADPMQAVGVPAFSYGPPTEVAPVYGSPVPTATNYGSSAMAVGIGPGQAAAPYAVPMAAATAPAAADPMAAVLPAKAAPVGLPVGQSAPESTVAIRSTRSRGGNNNILLMGIAGGAALLVLAVVAVLMNQPKPDVIADTGPTMQDVRTKPETKVPNKQVTPERPETSSGDSSDTRAKPEPAIPEPEMKPESPEPQKPEPVKPESTNKPEPAKPEPSKPEPTKPEPEPMKPAKPAVKPTKEQLQALSTLLTEARQAIREQKFEEATAKLAQADELPKLEEQDVVLDRLQQLTKHASAYRQAFEQGKQKLAVGQMLKVTASTQPEIVEVDAEKITISNKGEKRTYEFKTLPQGLFYAIADSAFEPGDVQQKIQRGAYVIALAADAKDAEKGKVLWDEAIESGAPLTLLLPVINDKYDAAQLEALAMVEPLTTTPEPMPSPSGSSPPSTKTRPGNPAAALPLLKKARDEISGHQFADAQAALAKAKPLLANEDQEAKHTRLALLLDYTKQFKDAIDRTLARLESGSTFEVGKTVVAVVEVKPREIVVRVNGTNRTYQRNELPIGMAVALGDMSLARDTPETKLVRGAYVVASSGKPEDIEKAKAWWQEAGRSVDSKTLLPVITDTYTK